MDVRPFRKSDAPELLELFKQTVHVVCRQDYSDEQLQAWAPQQVDLPLWSARLENCFTVVAETEEQLVGFVSLKDDGCVDMLYVAASFQSQNVATMLLAALEEKAQSLGIKNLYSDVSLTARRFFLRNGFVIEKEYVKKLGDVAFSNAIMTKALWPSKKS